MLPIGSEPGQYELRLLDGAKRSRLAKEAPATLKEFGRASGLLTSTYAPCQAERTPWRFVARARTGTRIRWLSDNVFGRAWSAP